MTVHETFAVRTVMRWLALAIFKFSGWKSEGEAPNIPKYVIIAAPHTSNWDFVYTLCLSFILRIKPRIMMKDSWFRGPKGYFFRWLGALPIDRSKANNTVAQSVEVFHGREQMILVVPPSGTRRKVMYWKTGFYYIALGAGVPIALGYLDYGRKAGGIGPLLHPTGDLEADMKYIRSFYSNVTARYPDQAMDDAQSGSPDLSN